MADDRDPHVAWPTFPCPQLEVVARFRRIFMILDLYGVLRLVDEPLDSFRRVKAYGEETERCRRPRFGGPICVDRSR